MASIEQSLFFLLLCGVAIIAILLVILVRLQQLCELTRGKEASAVARAIQQGDFDEIIRRAHRQLDRTPHHTRARWWLAKAYFAKEMWAEAQTEFETLSRHDPSWRAKHIQPYLDEIEQRMAELSDSK